MDGFQRHFDSQLLAYGKQTILNLVRTLTGPPLPAVAMAGSRTGPGGLKPGGAALKRQCRLARGSSSVPVRAATGLVGHGGAAPLRPRSSDGLFLLLQHLFSVFQTRVLVLPPAQTREEQLQLGKVGFFLSFPLLVFDLSGRSL